MPSSSSNKQSSRSEKAAAAHTASIGLAGRYPGMARELSSVLFELVMRRYEWPTSPQRVGCSSQGFSFIFEYVYEPGRLEHMPVISWHAMS